MDSMKKEMVKIKMKNAIQMIKKNRAVLIWCAYQKHELGEITDDELVNELIRIYEMTSES